MNFERSSAQPLLRHLFLDHGRTVGLRGRRAARGITQAGGYIYFCPVFLCFVPSLSRWMVLSHATHVKEQKNDLVVSFCFFLNLQKDNNSKDNVGGESVNIGLHARDGHSRCCAEGGSFQASKRRGYVADGLKGGRTGGWMPSVRRGQE